MALSLHSPFVKETEKRIEKFKLKADTQGIKREEGRIKVIEVEADRKLQDLAKKYEVYVQIEPLTWLRFTMPVVIVELEIRRKSKVNRWKSAGCLYHALWKGQAVNTVVPAIGSWFVMKNSISSVKGVCANAETAGIPTVLSAISINAQNVKRIFHLLQEGKFTCTSMLSLFQTIYWLRQ